MKKVHLVFGILVCSVILYFIYNFFIYTKKNITSYKEDIEQEKKEINIICKTNEKICLDIGRKFAKKDYKANVYNNLSTDEIKAKTSHGINYVILHESSRECSDAEVCGIVNN